MEISAADIQAARDLLAGETVEERQARHRAAIRALWQPCERLHMLAAEIEQTSLPAADRRLVTMLKFRGHRPDDELALGTVCRTCLCISPPPASAPNVQGARLDLRLFQRSGRHWKLASPDVCVADGRVPAPFLDDELEQGDAQRLDGMLLAEEELIDNSTPAEARSLETAQNARTEIEKKPPAWERAADNAQTRMDDNPDSLKRVDKLLVHATVGEVEAALAALEPDLECTLKDCGESVVVEVSHWRHKRFLMEHLESFERKNVAPSRKKPWLHQKLQDEKTCSTACFARLAKEVAQDFALERDKAPLRILQHATEGYMGEIYADAKIFAEHAGRSTVLKQDLALACRSDEDRKRRASSSAFAAGLEKGHAENKTSKKAKPARSSNRDSSA
ncbi:unnamed protein product [Symbiodinium sp. CCMP2592]|nr:unnamed protein product [Symbiodinium sp. CCMP2592]